jgi:hypothetical protein
MTIILLNNTEIIKRAAATITTVKDLRFSNSRINLK